MGVPGPISQSVMEVGRLDERADQPQTMLDSYHSKPDPSGRFLHVVRGVTRQLVVLQMAPDPRVDRYPSA